MLSVVLLSCMSSFAARFPVVCNVEEQYYEANSTLN